ncbi:hypothetical protein [Nocardioides acrostichi]|uniref:Uncharacterized protein n=1 Tax=Nocardioides acrostichi TaxID=2784339 RepID=A0A930YBL5_9ACTN|nr:hypothetical protein [Nocardioides acrostichi]MBF4162593.1 hypothetical protein [Nocardioides acrostichi]
MPKTLPSLVPLLVALIVAAALLSLMGFGVGAPELGGILLAVVVGAMVTVRVRRSAL